MNIRDYAIVHLDTHKIKEQRLYLSHGRSFNIYMIFCKNNILLHVPFTGFLKCTSATKYFILVTAPIFNDTSEIKTQWAIIEGCDM
jgi:hypothetical protein